MDALRHVKRLEDKSVKGKLAGKVQSSFKRSIAGESRELTRMFFQICLADEYFTFA